MSSQNVVYTPFVSIIIPVYNGKRTIRLCLDAILRQDYPHERYEVIVVDNNSKDGTPEIVQEYPVRLFYEREIQGPHAATNTGLRQACGELVVFTDSDCIAEPNWLSNMVAPFADETVVAVGGRIEAYKPEGRVERFLGEEIRPFTNCVRLSKDFPASILTGNGAYRLEALREVGFFNANLYTGAEVDLAWRVQWHTGKKAVRADNAVIYHKFEPGVRRLFRHFHLYGFSEIVLGTLYHKLPGYPRQPIDQVGIMLRQVGSLFIYLASIVYRSLLVLIGRRDKEEIYKPMLWFVSECGSLYGKLQGMWLTRLYTKQFWLKGPKVV
jgi:glycosyltransferase involved in cell wall biosynthesis